MRYYLKRFMEIPFVSILLVIVNVVIHIADIILAGELLWRGNLNVADILINGEYGRILWAMFLHADLNHLFNNMIILLFMGSMLEKEIGHVGFASIYLLSGVCGNVVSLIYKISQGSAALSIGASGAVFGMDGLLLALVLFSAKKIWTASPMRVVIMVVLSLYNGFASANIDNAAHVGGLLSGFFLGGLYCMIQRACDKYKERGKENDEG